ncbi:Bgt-20832 [Blumeria graminis f. sp. tritici]|uniref:Bgt-20832 n=2 Tax=Blumeria graminis f. sp. tritici TaxID=62690 RepID=A0A9X9MKK4_BLUGR|nr:Bgt-20832 [Blumeria graminis f. sp. tritici]
MCKAKNSHSRWSRFSLPRDGGKQQVVRRKMQPTITMKLHILKSEGINSCRGNCHEYS